MGARLGSVPSPSGFDDRLPMEPTMTRLKVLSTAAAMALVLPLLASTASFAQNPPPGGHPPARGAVPQAHPPGGGGGPRPGAGAAFRPSPGGGGGGGPRFSGSGGGYRGGGGFIPGAVAGAVIGGAIASQNYGNGYYDNSPGYYAPGYAPGYVQTYPDDQVYDNGPVAAAPAPDSDDAVAYCMQTYRSYDPRSGTYVGYDGYRHACP